MYQSIVDSHKASFDKAIEAFQTELAKVRTGRANPSILDGILVDMYGSKMPINQVAAINVPEPRMITIQPWDRSAIEYIERAIRDASDLGLNPVNDGMLIRLNIPPLTQERREQIVKMVNQKSEDTRVRVRGVREDVWKEIQKTESEGKMSEDDKFKGKDVLQKIVDEYVKKIDEMRKKKEDEIMTV